MVQQLNPNYIKTFSSLKGRLAHPFHSVISGKKRVHPLSFVQVNAYSPGSNAE